MNLNAHAYSGEAVARSRSELVEFPHSLPEVSNHNPIGPQDVPAMLFSFEHDVDEALGPMYPALALLDLVPEPHPTIDWPSLMDPAMSYPTPMLTDDASTTAYSASLTPSPASGTTLLDFSPFSGNADLAPTGDSLVDQPVASFPPLPNTNFDFMFPYEPMPPLLPFGPAPGLLHQDFYGNSYAHNHNQGQYWPGQQLSQHGVGAAGAVVPGLAMGMELNASTAALNAMDPALFSLPVHLPEPQREPVGVEEPKPDHTTNEKKRIRLDFDVEPDSPAGESSIQDDAPPKRKRKQDTTKRYPCPYPDCDSKLSRTHNLKVHIDAVHLGKRNHVCDEPGCARAFSRKHDLQRHYQSAHTDLGSPRNSDNIRPGKNAQASQAVKDEYEA